MKFWKSQWKKELEDSLPKNCSAVSQQIEQNGEQLSHVLTKRRNWIITAISLALALMIALAVGLSLIKPTNTLRVFALEINPSAVFVVDQKGVITNAVLHSAPFQNICYSQPISTPEGISPSTVTSLRLLPFLAASSIP